MSPTGAPDLLRASLWTTRY